MALTFIALTARALIQIGAHTILSFDEGAAEAEVAEALYSQVRDGLLSAHTWSFALGQATLPKLAAERVVDFSSAFQLPADFLRALSAGRGREVECRIAERRLHTGVKMTCRPCTARPCSLA